MQFNTGGTVTPVKHNKGVGMFAKTQQNSASKTIDHEGGGFYESGSAKKFNNFVFEGALLSGDRDKKNP